MGGALGREKRWTDLGTGDTGVEISCLYYIISFPSIPHNPNNTNPKPI